METVFAFDGICSTADEAFNPVQQGEIKLDARFGAALPNNVAMIVTGVFQNMIEIDKNRVVTSYI